MHFAKLYRGVVSDEICAKTVSEMDTLEFKEHTFTRDQLPSFKSFKIKILMTSTSQVYVPRMKDLRVIALA